MTPRPAHPYASSAEAQHILFGIFGMEDMESLNLFRQITGVAHLVSYLKVRYRKDDPLSAARMRLLIRLAADREMGHTAGLSPSQLSEFLCVGRNTVSALLNGLEDAENVRKTMKLAVRRVKD